MTTCSLGRGKDKIRYSGRFVEAHHYLGLGFAVFLQRLENLDGREKRESCVKRHGRVERYNTNGYWSFPLPTSSSQTCLEKGWHDGIFFYQQPVAPPSPQLRDSTLCERRCIEASLLMATDSSYPPKDINV